MNAMKHNRDAAPYSSFERIFNPRKLAIVGVTTTGFGFGRGILHSILAMGYDGEIYPVNPKGGECNGIPIYREIDDIPGDIDFAIIALPAGLVPDALEKCRQKNAAGAEILSAGFKETGTPEGIELEARVREIASRGIRVIGPNCFGIYCPESGITLLPGPELSRKSGPVAFLSQSGGMTIDFAHLGQWMGIHFSKMISFGNGADLRETEMLRYLGDDPLTGVIAMYVEGVHNGREFFSTLSEVSSKKPVILLKGGLSDAGQRAVASHTASLGGSRTIWESVLRQCNAIQASDLNDIADTCLAFCTLPRRPYHGIALVGGGGALGVAAADIAENFGLSIPALRDDIQSQIESLLPRPGSSAANPVDVANPYVAPEILNKVLTLAAHDSAIDIIILVQLLYHYKALLRMAGAARLRDIVPTVQLIDAVDSAIKECGKPVVMVLPNPKQDTNSIEIEEIIREVREECIQRGIPVYADMANSIRAIGNVSRYCARRESRSACCASAAQ